MNNSYYYKYLKYKNKYLSAKDNHHILKGGANLAMIKIKINNNQDLTEDEYEHLKVNDPVFFNNYVFRSTNIGGRDVHIVYKIIGKKEDVHAQKIKSILLNFTIDVDDIKDLIKYDIDVNKLSFRTNPTNQFDYNGPTLKYEGYSVSNLPKIDDLSQDGKDEVLILFCIKYQMSINRFEYNNFSEKLKNKYEFKFSKKSQSDDVGNYTPIGLKQDIPNQNDVVINKFNSKIPLSEDELKILLEIDNKYANNNWIYNNVTKTYTY